MEINEMIRNAPSTRKPKSREGKKNTRPTEQMEKNKQDSRF